jgi:hypothetical protein
MRHDGVKIVKFAIKLAAFLGFLAVATNGASAGEADLGDTLGAQTCGTSTCHAADKPWPNSAVSQVEHKVWTERDPHSKSFKALESERGQAIARRVGYGDATTADKCLGCHAHNVPEETREGTFDISEGVTCEACHGPASRWLGVHSSGLYYYSRNLEAGMYPTTDASARADLCLGCHVGEGDRFVTHRMMAAGHPPLPFELGFYSWFTKSNPEARSGYAHFTVDDDYLQRKPWPFGVKVWAIGQVAQARHVLALVTDPKNAPKGLFPEMALFDCRSCHRRRDGGGVAGPTLPRIKDANLIFAEFAAELVDPALAKKLRRNIGSLRGSSSGSWGAVISASRRLKKTLVEVEAKLKKHRFSIDDNKKTLVRIARAYRKGRLSGYESAEQAVLATGSLVDELQRLDILSASESAEAGDAMTVGLGAFKNNTQYSRRDVRASLNEIARIVAN